MKRLLGCALLARITPIDDASLDDSAFTMSTARTPLLYTDDARVDDSAFPMSTTTDDASLDDSAFIMSTITDDASLGDTTCTVPFRCLLSTSPS